MKTEIRKAALLLSSLPGPLAARLLDRMPSQQVAAIRQIVDGGKAPTTEERQQAVREFLQLSSSGENSKRQARRRLDSPGPPIRPFHFLTPLPPADIIRLLADELPQTQAAILAQLPAHLAAEVLALLTTDLRLQIVRRLSRLGAISDTALADMADVISQILNRRSPIRSDATLPAADVLGQLLASSSGPVHQIIAEAIEDCRTETEASSQSAEDLPD